MSSLLAIRGPLTGARFNLKEKDSVLIGRSDHCHIHLPDSSVSRVHARLRRQRHAWLIEDAGSSAGTFLNNQALRSETLLHPNDEIRIGHTIILYDSDFDVQNADFTDNSVYFSSPHDETIAMEALAIPEEDPERRDEIAGEALELLASIGELFDSDKIPFGEAQKQTVERMGALLRADCSILLLYDGANNKLRVSAAAGEGDLLADQSVIYRVYSERKALLLSDNPDIQRHPAPDAPDAAGVRSVLAAPMIMENSVIGVLYFERKELDAYSLKDLRLTQSLARLMAIFVESRRRLEAVRLRSRFHGAGDVITGESPAFQKTLEIIRKAAPSHVPLLLTGETGSGKEVLAREIHRLANESDDNRPFVAVNCAAIPATLFESELFGHEKGAFTGAHRMRQGYVEQANGGTLFLDEIGEMDLAMQPKLLRFLQEGTFFRVGGTRLHSSRVRLVAATNRDLVIEVQAGRFREDLFHRLSVLPIRVPALRERKEDIRPLAEYFCRKFAKSMGKPIEGLSQDAINHLTNYEWRGNIRELANCIERAVLLADGNVLLARHFQFAGLEQFGGAGSERPPAPQVEHLTPEQPVLRKLEDVEREHILKVMEICEQNQVRAADALGIHRNTLRKKLQQYGVLKN